MRSPWPLVDTRAGDGTRRGFLKAGLAALAGGWALLVRPVRGAAASEPESRAAEGLPRWGMVIDLDRCTACQSCTAACAVENNQSLGSVAEAARGRLNRWIHIVAVPDVGGERGGVRLVPIPCQHCENPPCVKVCPTSATYMNPEGIVGQVYSRCIGCRYCVNACPYTCKYFNWSEPKWPGDMAESHNPDVSPREKGVVEKCLFCHHRLQRARDRARAEGRRIREADYVPACVTACPTGAIGFGDLNDPESSVSQMAGSPRAFRLLEDLGTRPKVAYLRER